MSSLFSAASARLRLLPAGRATSTSYVLQQSKLASSSKSTRAIRATISYHNLEPMVAHPFRQFSTSDVNGFNPETETTRTESIEIPPLDLLSVLNIPTANMPPTEEAKPATSIDVNVVETPQKEQNSSKSLKLPYYGVGDADKSSSQPSSNPKKVLTEQISQLKKKLNNKSLSKIQRNKLQSRLKQKQKDLDRLGGPAEDELLSKRGLAWDKRDKMASGTMSKRGKRRSRNARTHNVWENIITDSNIQESYPATQRIRAKSYALPRPRASSQGVLIPDFASDVIRTQANGTILARSGTTSVLSTVILVPPESTKSKNKVDISFQQTVLDSIQQMNARNGSLFLPLHVEFRERYHASGKIPTHNQRRRDNSGPLSEREVLSSRAIDRTIRPWLMQGLAEFSDNGEVGDGVSLPENIVVNCSVQSYDTRSSTMDQLRTHADPTSLAINSAIAAIYQSSYSSNPSSAFPVPKEAAACVKLAMRRDGTVIYDPTPSEVEECAFELLYAGTKDRVLMLEFSAKGDSGEKSSDDQMVDPAIPEENVADALRLAQEAILPLIKHQEELRLKYSMSRGAVVQKDEEEMSDEELAQVLGLTISQNVGISTVESLGSVSISNRDAVQLLERAYAFIWTKLEGAALKSFGCDAHQTTRQTATSSAYIHDGKLLSKKLRGRRETLMQNEVTRLLRYEFQPNGEVAVAYNAAVSDESNTAFLTTLTNHIHERIMQKAFGTAAARGFRSDGRQTNAVRPITATAPLFPDCVHGSSQFSRGETQVLSTATISAPKDGTPIINPFVNPLWKEDAKDDDNADDEKVPVGSLRFLRSQVELESDMNSRRVKAGREMTGDSGVLSERKRAFLHYDFPDYSTGLLKSRAGGVANRRAIGHGNLAERAILPVLPRPDVFPYSLRLTCEVTSSNGSSSMASACAATLSLLDVGVPIRSPVAGVSVGLASSETLLLDITGTEDHFGNMDCKVCGTFGGVTAIQCDVKNPIKLDAIINALDLAKQGRHAILNEMNTACMESLGGLIPRSEMKSTAPRVEVIKYDANRKRDLIGPGGTVLRQLEDRFNVNLDLSQEGRCLIFGSVKSVEGAKNVIMDLVGDVEEGGVYEGTVIEIRDYGAVIELLRNKEGLLHVSEITDDKIKHPGGNVGLVNEYLKVGDKIQVLCTNIDHVQGSIKLSRKKLLRNQQYLSTIQQPEHNIDNGVEVLDDEYKDSDLESVEWQSEDESYRPHHDVNNEDLLKGFATANNDATAGDSEDGDDLYDNDLADADDSEELDLDDNPGEQSKDFESLNNLDDDESGKRAQLSSLTVLELREKLRDAGLPVSDKKIELIERLDNAPYRFTY